MLISVYVYAIKDKARPFLNSGLTQHASNGMLGVAESQMRLAALHKLDLLSGHQTHTQKCQRDEDLGHKENTRLGEGVILKMSTDVLKKPGFAHGVRPQLSRLLRV